VLALSPATFLLLTLQATAQAPTLGALVARSEAKQVTTAVWFREAAAEHPFYTHRASSALIPASNMKLFTGAITLQQLGPAFRFRTRYYLHRTPNGLALRIQSGGDPGIASGNPVYKHPFDGLVAELGERNISALPGGLLFDANGFTGPARPPTWEAEDLGRTYAAPTGPFVLEEGCFGVTLDPAGRKTGNCALSFVPAGFEVPVRGHIRLTGSRKRGSRPFIAFDSKGVRLEGLFFYGFGPRTFRFPDSDPQGVFAQVLVHSLKRAGISAAVATMPEHLEEGELVYTQETPIAWPLARLLGDSNNFQAEQVLRVVARQKTGSGTLEAGRKLMQARLRQDGIGDDEWHVADASGLSRANRVSARVIGGLLAEVDHASWRRHFVSSLSLAGRSGTLSRRMKGELFARVRGKTGTLSGVSSLSGFLVCKSGKTVLFSILMNYDRKLPSRMRDLRKLQDQMLQRVFETR